MSRPFFLFAPGAGAPSSHRWMQCWAQRLSSLGRVAAFDYPYMQEGRKRPDPLPQLVAAHRRALMDNRLSDEEVFLVGKSMGGRIGCHLSLVEKVSGLICFGYPLCGGGDVSKLRDKVLRDLTTPILFIQGSRDPLGPLELLESVRREMTAANALYVVDGGDHSLLVRKRDLVRMQTTQEEVDNGIANIVSAFVRGASPADNGRSSTDPIH